MTHSISQGKLDSSGGSGGGVDQLSDHDRFYRMSRLNMKPENLKARQGKATVDIIDARTEDWTGQFIIIYNK